MLQHLLTVARVSVPFGDGVLDDALDDACDDDLDDALGTSRRTAGTTRMQLSSERDAMPNCAAA
eukprot:scaffold110443_cov66-Phaeocystis_antarctica.AAC.1